MSEPVASETPPEKRSLLAILLGVVATRDFALRVMIGAVGAVALGWLGPKWAFAGLVLSQLLADTIKEFVTARNWSVRRLWFVSALALLFDRIRHRIGSTNPTPVAAPLVSTLAATVVVLGGFTAVETARGQSLLGHGHRTFFGGTSRSAVPSVRLPNGRVITKSAGLSFHDVRVGGSSKPELLVLSSGSQELRRLHVEASPHSFHVKNACPRRLPAHEKCGVGIVFQPDHPGRIPGRLTISFVDDPTLTLMLAGTAVKAVGATLNPMALRFRTTTVEATAPVQTITLHAGSDQLRIAKPTTGSNEFTVAATDCKTQLSAGGYCRIRIAFRPLFAGIRRAELTITHRHGGRPLLAATLTGRGLPRKHVKQTTLTPPSGTFPTLSLNTSSRPIEFTLTAGSNTVTVASISKSSDYRIIATPTACQPAAKVLAGETCTISVIFRPRAAGPRRAELVVTLTNGTRLKAKLFGSGVLPPTPFVVLDPASLSFKFCIDCQTKPPTEGVTLKNTGKGPLTISDITSDGAEFTVDYGDCLGTVPVGGTCQFSVTFTASTQGSYTANITIAANKSGGQLTLPVKGYASIG